MPHIDLNADLGEGGVHDTRLIALVSSANIACGGHAGSPDTMRAAIDAALAANVAIGAHPGYEDPEHFGRRPLDLSPTEAADLVSRQIERLARLNGGRLHHVKPHGALYNQADRDADLAAAVVRGITRLFPDTGFYVPPGGALAAAGAGAGLNVRPEGFADRRYQTDGSLVPRSEPDAVIDNCEAAVTQALQIVRSQSVNSTGGAAIPMPARTLCVHGDGPSALSLLRAVRDALRQAGYEIRA